MKVGHIILGRPWLYDLDTTNFGRSNVCVFNFKWRKVKIHPLPPKDNNDKKKRSEKEFCDREGSERRNRGLVTKGRIPNQRAFRFWMRRNLREIQENLEGGTAGEPSMFVLVTKEVTNKKAIEIPRENFRMSFLMNYPMSSHLYVPLTYFPTWPCQTCHIIGWTPPNNCKGRLMSSLIRALSRKVGVHAMFLHYLRLRMMDLEDVRW